MDLARVEVLEVTASVTASICMPQSTSSRSLDALRRALEVAAAGGHNVLMVGPTGHAYYKRLRSLY